MQADLARLFSQPPSGTVTRGLRDTTHQTLKLQGCEMLSRRWQLSPWPIVPSFRASTARNRL